MTLLVLVQSFFIQGPIDNLPGALGKSLDSRNDLVSLCSTDNDFDLCCVSFRQISICRAKYLDGAAVNEETVELLEGPASAICSVEDDVGDAAALRVGAVGELYSLDGADGLDEVLLSGESNVSIPKACS